LHQHYFAWASKTLSVGAGEVVYAYVYLDPANPPSEVMLQWNDGSWEHRAYWGANNIIYGADGTASRYHAGPLPVLGQWVRLEVPASAVALEGSTLNGMAFTLYNGRATWDNAGKSSPTTSGTTTGSTTTTTTSGTMATNNLAWFDDTLPAGAISGADGGDSWSWTAANPVPFWGGLANQSSLGSGLHQHYFYSATQTLSVNAGESVFAYVYIDPANVPSEIMLQWNDGTSWDHRAYWGAHRISYGALGTASCRYMGPLPAAGQWARLEVPASLVGLEGTKLSGMAFTLFDGRATWDYAGKLAISTSPVTGASGSSNGSATTSTNTSSTNGITLVGSVNWMDDALPAGAIAAGDGVDFWTWVSSNPTPISGGLAHQSVLSAGLHQHYFTSATSTLAVNAGEALFATVYLDPANTPSELMLQWNDGSWEHRAYWGANQIGYGTDGTAGHTYMGALPAAGQWVRLQVPASKVGLEGRTVSGMAFSLYGGRATFDNTGKSTGVIINTSGSGTTTNIVTIPVTNTTPPVVIITNVPPPVTSTNSASSTNFAGGTTTTNSASPKAATLISDVDYTSLALPKVGDSTLHILTPTMLELKLINTKAADPSTVSIWNLVDANGNLQTPSTAAFTVTADGQTVPVSAVGFKRRPLYAPFEAYDLRIENSLYLQLGSPIADNKTVLVKNNDGSLWTSANQFVAKVDPLRYSPAIHVNQEGYMPNFVKKAMVGYYVGNLGELTPPKTSGFTLVDATTGTQVYQGSLVSRLDTGYTYSPAPYQKVYEADFTSFNTPGEYRLLVPGMGASLPFMIDAGISMNFARGYALGLYHQRCGTSTAMPFTRFDHDACHNAPASVPMPAASYSFTWNTIANYGQGFNSDNPRQTAAPINATSQLFPFVRQGTLDTTGGHHDAGDYSKYTINSASLTHFLMFSADSLAGVAALDNLGTPESGDGISDVLQEAKWEADYLAKIQDTDGGFYFLVYPTTREYEGWVTPDHGDPQVVWPKTTSVTAAAVAALAQCASSPAMKRAYPAAAAMYLQKAQLGWQFLMNAINTYGKNGAYQKITHYGDTFADQDELAWAACEMYLATGDQSIHQKLLAWFNPSDPATMRWGWWHMSECYGHAIRSYAFGARSGRVASSALDQSFLAKCEAEIIAAGDNVMNWSRMSAYGTSFPDATKRVMAAGWYFSTDQAFDIAVAYQLTAKADYMTAMIANMNFEGGCNPVNVAYVTGMGWKRQRDIVSQWHSVDSYRMPPSGIPYGNVTATFTYLYTYGGALENLSFPSDSATVAPYPFYDRWGDSWNVNAEMVVLNQARSLGTLAFLAAQTPLKTQVWHSIPAQIVVPTAVVPPGSPITLTLQAPGLDLGNARITWETRDEEPSFGQTLTFSPRNNGTQWVEAEAQLPDGRRVFAKASFTVNSPNIVWFDDGLPTGAQAAADGGDSWNWVGSSPSPKSGGAAHQSAAAAGSHQHYFDSATSTMTLTTGDVLYSWVYLDPSAPPSEIMLQWNDGTWDHRAYWGANTLSYGLDGTNTRRNMGALPAPGQWVQLKVPAAQVGLEGKTVKGMAFTLYDGKATWDTTGRLSAGQ
jgi:hypothetical protein